MSEISSALRAYLLSTQVVEDVQRLLPEVSTTGVLSVQLLSRIRKEFPEFSQVIAELVLGSYKANRLAKLPTQTWLCTQACAEQATHPVIANHHAQRFVGAEHLLEICTGAGFDTFALAQTVEQITTIECDTFIATIAQGNMLRSGLKNVTVLNASFPECIDTLPHIDAVWADPARRFQGKRFQSNEQLMPSLQSVVQFAHPSIRCGIKLGPATETPVTLEYSKEYIGFRRECKEQILWKNTGWQGARTCVTVLDTNEVWYQRYSEAPKVRILEPEAVLIEPHNAIIASGGVGDWFAEHNIGVVHPSIAYGVSKYRFPPSGLYEQFQIVKVDTNIQKRSIQQRVRELHWNKNTEIKKRGVELNPSVLHSSLEFGTGPEHGVILLMRLANSHATVYAKRL